MAASTVGGWKACVDDLNKLLELPNSDAHTQSLLHKVSRFIGSPVSTSTMNKLVQQQVVGRLSSVCAAAVRQDSSSDAHSTTAVAAFAAVRTLLDAVGKQEGLVSMVWQQVDQSGLVSQLVVALGAAAEELGETSSSSSGGSGSNVQTQMGGNSNVSRNSVSGGRIVLDRRSSKRMLQAHVSDLLKVVDNLRKLSKGEDRREITLVLAPATTHLVLAAMQHADRQLRAIQQQQQQLESSELAALGDVVHACCGVMLTMPEALLDSRYSAAVGPAWYDRLDAASLQSSVLPCMALMAAVSVFALTTKWDKAHTHRAPDSGSANNSSRSRSANSSNIRSGTSAEAAKAVFQQLSKHVRDVTPCQQLLLLKSLGADSSMVLFAAGMMRAKAPTALLDVLLGGSMSVINDATCCAQPQAHPQQQPLQVLMLPLYLHYATHSQGELREVARAGAVCCDGLLRWAEAVDEGTSAGSQGGTQPHLSPEVLNECLPQVLQLLHSLLESKDSKQHSAAVIAYLGVLYFLLRYSAQSATGVGAAWTIPQVVQDSMPAVLRVLDSSVRYCARLAPAIPDTAQLDFALSCVADILEKFAQYACLTGASSTTSSSSASSGSSGPTQLQLFVSLLSSTLKLSSLYSSLPPAAGLDAIARRCRVGVVSAVEELLRHATGPPAATPPSAGVANSRGEPCTVASSSSATGSSLTGVLASVRSSLSSFVSRAPASSTSTSTVTAADLEEASAAEEEASADSCSLSATSILPCLGLWGRCCLQVAHLEQTGAAPAVFPSTLPLLLNAAQVRAWLSLPSVSEQLSAAGYQIQETLQQLEAAAGASMSGFEDLAQQLTVVGNVLSHFAANSVMCNNPGCSNVGGSLDIALASGLGCVCGGCLTARYCCKDCQRVHWKAGHKPVCQALAAAQGAAAKAAASAEVEAAAGGSTDASAAGQAV